MERAINFSIIFLLTIWTVNASVLSDAANSLEAGQSIKITTPGFSDANEGSPTGGAASIISWGQTGWWSNGEGGWIGKTDGDAAFFNLKYNETSNAWSRTNDVPGPMQSLQRGHGYDFNAFDSETGDLYIKPYNSDTVYRKTGSVWSALSVDIPGSQSCCEALEFWPDKGVVYSDRGGVRLWDGFSWSYLVDSSQLADNGYSSMGEVQPNADVYVFTTGQNEGSMLYKLDTNGDLTELTNAPTGFSFSTNSQGSILVHDPSSEEYIAWDKDSDLWYSLNPTGTSSWSSLDICSENGDTPCTGVPNIGIPQGNIGIAIPIPDYNVIMFIERRNDDVWLYKHGGSQSWQKTLESNFDIVSTFDELQDWQGGTGYHDDIETMPKMLDNSNSLWNYYTNDGPAVDDWIKLREQEYTWSGKSLCINYNNFVGGIDGYGPSRLGTYFGDIKEYNNIHMFYMVKFHDGFFNLVEGSQTEFEWVGVVKFVDILSGFTAARHWGNETEYSSVCDGSNGPNCGPAPNGGSCKGEYGLNFNIFNVNGGGLSNAPYLYFIESPTTAVDETTCYRYQDAGHKTDLRVDRDGKVQDFYMNKEWFGLEIRLDRGSVGNDDASQDLWLYDQDGNEVLHVEKTNINMLQYFDHKYNKITLGGNRFGAGYHQDAGDSDENRWYADDFIVDDERIGPKYFSLLDGQVTCSHAADNNPCNGEISTTEIATYIERWLDGAVGLGNMMEAIGLWKQ